MAHQLAQLAKLTWTRHHRDSKQLVEHHLETPTHDDGIEFGPERRQYRERMEQLVAEGRSDDGTIRARTRGFLTWEFRLAPDCLRRLSEDQFVTQLQTAITRLREDHSWQVTALKEEIYGSTLPPSSQSRRASR